MEVIKYSCKVFEQNKDKSFQEIVKLIDSMRKSGKEVETTVQILSKQL